MRSWGFFILFLIFLTTESKAQDSLDLDNKVFNNYRLSGGILTTIQGIGVQGELRLTPRIGLKGVATRIFFDSEMLDNEERYGFLGLLTYRPKSSSRFLEPYFQIGAMYALYNWKWDNESTTGSISEISPTAGFGVDYNFNRVGQIHIGVQVAQIFSTGWSPPNNVEIENRSLRAFPMIGLNLKLGRFKDYQYETPFVEKGQSALTADDLSKLEALMLRIVKEVDSDNDGVPNIDDREINSNLNAVVDQFGVELDDDNDGIPNSVDLEPNSEADVFVNAFGQTLDHNSDELPVLKPIYFGYNKYDIQNVNSLDKLEDVASYLKANEHITVEIIGFTDQTGNEKYNLELSVLRAKEVFGKLRYHYMISQDRLSFRGAGEDSFSSGPPSDMFKRRVVFKLKDTK